MVSSFNTKSSGYRNCKYCQGAGCLFCNSERKKAEGAQQAAEQQRTERLKAMTPEEILNELPATRTALTGLKASWQSSRL